MRKIFAILLIVAFVFSMTLVFASCVGVEDTDTDLDTESNNAVTSDTDGEDNKETNTETDKTISSESETETETDEPTGPIYYTVYVEDQLGQPVEGVDLQICNDKLCLPQKITDAEGVAKYEYGTLEAFKVQINSVPEGYVMTTEKTPFPEGKTSVRVIVKRLETYTITATDMHGKPLENILVELLDGALDVIDSFVTEADGRATFTVEPGIVNSAKVSHSEGNGAFTPVGGHQIGFANGKSVTVQFAISEEAFFYTIFVKDKNGVAVKDVELLLYNKNLKLIGSATTKEDGVHSFKLQNGDYYVVVNSKNGLYGETVEFKKNGAMTANMTISEEPAGSSRDTAIFLPGDFEVTLSKDTSIWYSVPDFDGKVVEIKSVKGIVRYGIKDIPADENGVIRIELNSKDGGKFKLSTTSEDGEKIVGEIYRPGSFETPYEIDVNEIGDGFEFNINLPANKEIYYSFVADKDGTVRIESTTEYAYILINGNPNKKSVKAGETVLICFASRDDDGVNIERPAIDIVAEMTFAKTYADYSVNVILGNEAYPNASVELYRYENGQYVLDKTAMCDENGAYTFANIEEKSNYFVKAICGEDYETQAEYLPFGEETSLKIHVNHKRDGSMEYPFLVHENELESSTKTITLEAEKTVYYTIFFVPGATISIDNKDVKLEIIVGGQTVEILTGEILSYDFVGEVNTNTKVLLKFYSSTDAEVELTTIEPKNEQ